jgi:hypothetical protein
MESVQRTAAEQGSLALDIRPSPGDRPSIESAEDSWPLRLGVIVVAVICLCLALLL